MGKKLSPNRVRLYRTSIVFICICICVCVCPLLRRNEKQRARALISFAFFSNLVSSYPPNPLGFSEERETERRRRRGGETMRKRSSRRSFLVAASVGIVLLLASGRECGVGLAHAKKSGVSGKVTWTDTDTIKEKAVEWSAKLKDAAAKLQVQLEKELFPKIKEMGAS